MGEVINLQPEIMFPQGTHCQLGNLLREAGRWKGSERRHSPPGAGTWKALWSLWIPVSDCRGLQGWEGGRSSQSRSLRQGDAVWGVVDASWGHSFWFRSAVAQRESLQHRRDPGSSFRFRSVGNQISLFTSAAGGSPRVPWSFSESHSKFRLTGTGQIIDRLSEAQVL